MAAIIAGEGLGYFNSSLSNGISSQGGQATLGQAKENIFVNAATGNLVVQGQDEIIKGLGLGFGMSRTYNSLGNFDGDNNDQWRLGFISDISLEGTANQAGSLIVRTTADGYEQVFNYDTSAGHYISTKGADSHDVIIWQGATALFKLDGREQQTETYNTLTNQLIARADANGNTTSINYSAGKPTSISVSTKTGIQTTNLLYNAAGLLEKIETIDPASSLNAVKVYYGYDAENRLNSIKIDNTPDDRSISDNDVYQIAYTYHGTSNRLASISQSDGTSFSIEYEDNGAGDYRVVSTTQSGVNGSMITSYNYISESLTRVTYNNSWWGFDESIDYQFDTAKRLESLKRTINGQIVTTQYGYTSSGQLETIQDGLNHLTRFTYDSKGNQTSVTDPEMRAVTRTFSTDNLLLTETTGSNTSRFVYDGSNLRFAVAADGSVTEYQYDAFGLRTSMRQYTVSRYDVGGLTETDNITLLSLESWVSNLTNVEQQLAEYQYDFRGQLSAVTQYNQIDLQGNGAGAVATQKFVYDYNGNLLQEISARSVETGAPENYRKTYQYDGLGRRVQATDSLGVVTSYVFDDASQSIVTQYANGLWQTEVYDHMGRIIEAYKGTSEQSTEFEYINYVRDARGQVVAEISNQGNTRTYNLHDSAGRIAATVDESGAVTRYFYNNANQLISTVRYDNKVNTESWYDNEAIANINVKYILASLNDLITVSDQDRRTEYMYNKAGQLRFVLDPEGYVTESRYNARGQLVATITYDDIVTDLTAFASADNSAIAQRASLLQYNKNGQLEFETDAEGYLTQYYYDGAGNNIAIRHYASAATPLTAVASADDKVSFSFYDAAGRLKATIDSDGKVSSMQYDVDGNLTEQLVYATAVRDHQLGNALILPAGEKRSTYYQYDKRGALTLESASDGSAITYHYDDMGQLIKRQAGSAALLSQTELSVAELQNDISTERFAFDKLGRQTASLDANQNAQLADASAAEIEAAFNNTGAMQKQYDYTGNLVSVVDARGFKTLFYYDEKQQLRYMVDAAGQITEYTYTSFGQREQTREYINQFNTTELAGLTGGAYSSVQALVEAKRDDINDITTSQEFDKRGLTASSTDADNYVSEFKYNAFTQLIKQTTRNKLSEGAGETPRVDEFSYDKRGLLLQQLQDVGGAERISTNTYDAFGRLDTTTNAAQQLTTFEYDTQRGISPDQVGKVVISKTMVNGTERQSISRYDLFGRVYQQVDAHGNITSYTYNDADNSITVTGADNVQQVTRRDARGRVTEVRVQTADDAVLQNNHYVYDANGNMTERWLNGVKQETRTFDNNNQQLTSTDANGKQISTSYDGVGRVITRITDPDGLALTTSWDYQKRGTIVDQKQFFSATEARVTTTHFDKKGRVKEVIRLGLDPVDGSVEQLKTQYSYDRTGNKLTVTEGAGSSQPIITSYQYNALGQLVSSAKGDDAPTQYIYNDKGQLVEQRTMIDQITTVTGTINRYAQQVYRYNDAGELTVKLTVSAVSPTLKAAVERYEYDKLGRQVSTHRYSSFLTLSQTQTALTADLIALDSSISSFIGSADKVSDYTVYDSENRKTAYIDATGATTLYHYDGLGRVTEQVRKGRYADISAANISALKAGTFTASAISYKTGGVADARIANVYDNQGRLSYSLTDIDGNQAAVKHNSYDAAGNLVKTTAYAKTVAYQAQYTATTLHNALISKGAINDTNNRVNGLFYDKADRLRFNVDSSGAVTESRYDNSGKTATVVQYASALPNTPLAAKFTAGTLTFNDLQTQYQGNVFTSTDRVTENSYDNAGRLIAVKDAEGFTESYKYSANGLLFSRIDKNDKEWRFNYDNSGRVSAEFSPMLTGIKTLVGDAYQSINGFAVKQYQYDATGNVTAIKEGVHQGSSVPGTVAFYGQVRETTFGYDAAGRQIKVTQPVAENAPITFSTTEYDALGRAVRSAVMVDTSNEFVTFISTVSQKHHVYDAAGRLQFELDATELDWAVTTKANVSQYQYDVLGNQTSVKRFANTIDLQWLHDNTSWGHGQPLTATDVFASKNVDGVTEYALVTDTTKDRILTTTYYANGLKKAVTEASRTYYYLDADGYTRNATGSPTTHFSYNAFGDIWKTSVLSHRATTEVWSDNFQGYSSTEHWSDSYYYYSNTGNKIASVDAGGYLTTWQYNSFGQVNEQTEYARAINSSALTANLVPTPPAAGNAITGQDRKTTYAYDEMGRLLTETKHNVQLWQRSGSSSAITALATTSTVNSYDALGQLRTVSQNGNLTSDIGYDVLGNISSTKSASFAALTSTDAAVINNTSGLQNEAAYTTVQQITAYQYDVFGNAVEIRQKSALAADDIVTQHKYNSRGQAIETTNAMGQKVTAEFDHAGRLINSTTGYTEPSDVYSYQVYHFVTEYDAEHNRDFVYRAPMPGWLTFDVSSGTFSGRAPETGSITLRGQAEINGDTRIILIELNYTAGDFVENSLTGWDTVDIEEAEKEVIQSYTYNLQGQLTQQALKIRQTGQPTVTESWDSFSYNSFGEVATENGTFYNYDLSGNLLSTNKNNAVKTNGVDLAGRVVATADNDDFYQATAYALDSLGRITTVFLPNFILYGEALVEGKIQQDFDRWGNVTRYTDANGYVYRYQYNALNKVTVETRPDVIDVDQTGQASVISPTTQYRYDVMGNLLETEDHYGNKTGQVFNTLGQLVQTIDALNTRSYSAFDQFGRQVATQNSAGMIATTSYNAAGQVTAVGDIRQQSQSGSFYNHTLTTYSYNNMGHRVSQLDAAGFAYQYKHDARGNVIYAKTPEGQIKEFAYDRYGNKTLERYSNVYANNDLNQNTWQYSEFGNLIAHNDLGGKNYNYTYVTYEKYDEDGNYIGDYESNQIETVTSEHGQSLRYSYYENGWIESVIDETTGARSGYVYDAAGQRTVEESTSVNAFNETIRFTTYTNYDSNGRIKSVNTTDTTGRDVSKIIYSYDALGNRRSMKVWNGYEGQLPYVDNYAPEPEDDVRVQVNAEQQIPEQLLQFWDPDNSYGDTPSYEYTFRINGEQLSLAEIQLQFPWLEILTIDGTGSIAVSGTAPTSFANQTLHLEVTASDGDLVSRSADLYIDVEGPATWAPIRNQYLVQHIEFDYSIGRNGNDITGFLQGNTGATYRIGTSTAETVGGPIDVSDALDTAALSQGILAINPNYTGDVEQLTLTLIATVNGEDIISDSFTVILDYSPGANEHTSVSVSPGEQLNETIPFTDRNLTTDPNWLDNPITTQPLVYTYWLDYEEVVPDSNGLINGWLQVSTGEDGVIISNGSAIPNSAARDTPYQLRIQASDGYNTADTINVDIQVQQGVNQAPIGDIPDIVTNEGDTFNYNIATYLTDPDGDTINYTAQVFVREYDPELGQFVEVPVAMPQGLIFSSNGSLSGIPDQGTNGIYIVRINADDGIVSTQREFTLTIASVITPPVGNTPPTVSPLPDKVFMEGDYLNFSVGSYFTDADGDSLRFTATGLPPETVISRFSGNIRGRLPWPSAGTYNVTVTATDPDGASVSGIFTLTVNAEPVGINQAPRAIRTANFAVAGQYEYFSYTIPTTTFMDPDGDPLTYSVSGLPEELFFSGDTISGVLSEFGSYRVIITATDPSGESASSSLTIRVLGDRTLLPRVDTPTDPSLVNMHQSHDEISIQNVTNYNAFDAGTRAAEQQVIVAPLSEPNPTEPATVQEHWFSYDQLSRVVIDGGTLTAGQLSITDQGQYLEYNSAGQQSMVIANGGRSATQYSYNAQGLLGQVNAYKNTSNTDLYTNPDALNSANWRKQATYQYDELNRISQTNNYFGLNETTSIDVWGELPEGDVWGYVPVTIELAGALKNIQHTYYRGDGNVKYVEEFGLDSSWHDTLAENLGLNELIFPSPGQRIDGSYGVNVDDLDLLATTSYGNFYNPAGINSGYIYTKNARFYNENSSTPESYQWMFTKTLEARGSFLEKSVSGVATSVSSGSFTPASTFSTYDVNGNRIAVEERVNGETQVEARHFFYSADGQLLRKFAGTQTSLLSDPTANTRVGTGFVAKGAISNYQYSNGNYLGEYDTDGNVFFKEQHFSAPDSSSTSSQRYTARAGDTLQGIAQLFYGSSDYWYIIASANGLSADSPLQEGTALDIPSRANSENRSDSFKPMDLAQIIGDTTPALPYAPPPPAAGCNALATIIIIAIVVVVTVYTAGAGTNAAASAGASVGSASATTAAGATTITTAAGTTLGVAGTGTAALSGGLGVAGAVGAGVGGAVGALAGQVAGNILGVQNGYSLKNALASGLTAGFTAGLGSALGAGTTATLSGAQKVALAAGSSIAGTAANKLVGNQASFNWRNVATSALTAGAMHRLGLTDPNSPFERFNEGQGIVSGTLSGIAGAAIGYGAGKLIQQGNDRPSWNFSSVATDAFGNALGNSFVASRVKAEEDKLKAAAKADSAANNLAAVASGADPASPEAAQQLFDKYASPGQRDQVRFDETDGNLRISLEGGNSAGAVNLTTGVTDIGMVRQQHEALIDFIFANNLTTDSHSALLGISQQLYTQRSDYYSDDNIAGRMQIARDDGITRGIYNVNQATMLRKASFTDFDGNLTGADLWGAARLVQNDFVNAINTTLEYGSYMVGGAGLLAGGVRLAGKGLLATAQAGFRGSFIHGSSKLGAIGGMAKGSTVAGLGYGTAQAGWNVLTNPAGVADTVRTISSDISRTGGFTYATGIAGEIEAGAKFNMAAGVFVAVDFKNGDMFGSFYANAEAGGKLGLAIPSANLNLENTLYTSPDFTRAMAGGYTHVGLGDNWKNTNKALGLSYVSADKGNIGGIQLSTQLFGKAPKTGLYRDPNAFSMSGEGGYYDWRRSKWVSGGNE
ncbi:putative Ig domain-containing protein [Arsukibacterium perlucidum]|uniref:putative Ig domain-containing protein n=1 Tax=Arsukibacterium perlucidum TaxID=368811 RepID=UPI00039ED626|nr:putative Ig domain-containing protein [Arsukibacterium perlucidum]